MREKVAILGGMLIVIVGGANILVFCAQIIGWIPTLAGIGVFGLAVVFISLLIVGGALMFSVKDQENA